MDFRIITLVYGELYIDYFLNYSFPSLMSPNNIPAIAKLVNVEHQIYVHTQEEKDRLSNELSKYNSLLSVKVCLVTDIGMQPSHQDINYFWEYFKIINPVPTPLIFSNADNVWSDGSLSFIVDCFMKGYLAIYIPFSFPVEFETLGPELSSIRENGIINLPPLLAQQLVLKHITPWNACFNYGSQRCTNWPESLLVPVGTEGILVYLISRIFHAFIPGKFEIINTWYINENFDPNKFYINREAKNCLTMGLQSLQKNYRPPFDGGTVLPHGSLVQFLQRLQYQGGPSTVGNYSAFLKDPRWKYPLSFNIETFKVPTRFYITENPTEELWDRTEKEMQGFIQEIINGNGPESWNSIEPISDKQLFETLEWLEPVFNGRFPQAVLEYLRN